MGSRWTHVTELIGPSRLEPDIKQGVGQPLPQAYFESLLKPGLGHDERQQDGDDDEEDNELVQERDRIWMCRKPFVSEFQLLGWRSQWRRNRCSRAGILIDP